MQLRLVLLGLIALVLVMFCLTAAAKLNSTQKYDQIRVGMTTAEVGDILGGAGRYGHSSSNRWILDWEAPEGCLSVEFHPQSEAEDEYVVVSKNLTRRGPLERLAWLCGWQS